MRRRSCALRSGSLGAWLRASCCASSWTSRRPTAAFHSTINTGWEPLNLLAIYNPAGPEVDLRGLPDFGEVPAGSVPGIGISR